MCICKHEFECKVIETRWTVTNRALQALPELPEFQLSLRPEEYQLPEIDSSAWSSENCEAQSQTLKEHLNDSDYETLSEWLLLISFVKFYSFFCKLKYMNITDYGHT